MNLKYQIFVSSTYTDLKTERDQAIKAILEMGHIPVGMEMFSAGDEEQWLIIKKAIDDCDYYVVISAHRYGSMDGLISYTEKEYDYAVSQGVPTLGFVIEEDTKWSTSKMDKEPEKIKKLTDFKSKIKKKYISYWKSKDDLYGKISIALMKQFSTTPRIGWVKANELVGPKVITELTRLSSENSNLRDQVDKLTQSAKREEESRLDKIITTLQRKSITLSFYYEHGEEWESHTPFTYYELFKSIAPQLMVECSVISTSRIIGVNHNPDISRKLRREWPIPSNYIKIVLADFSVLELIKPSEKKHSLRDTEDYWVIAETGKNLHKLIRRDVLEFSEDTTDIIPEDNNKTVKKKK